MPATERSAIRVTLEFDPEEMSRRGKIGAHRLHSRYDSKQLTEPARKAFLDRFEREVDPAGKLAPDERRRRAEHARKAHFLRLARLSAEARRARRSEKKEAAT